MYPWVGQDVPVPPRSAADTLKRVANYSIFNQKSAEVVQTTKDYLAKCVVLSINVRQSRTAEESYQFSWVK